MDLLNTVLLITLLKYLYARFAGIYLLSLPILRFTNIVETNYFFLRIYTNANILTLIAK